MFFCSIYQIKPVLGFFHLFSSQSVFDRCWVEFQGVLKTSKWTNRFSIVVYQVLNQSSLPPPPSLCLQSTLQYNSTLNDLAYLWCTTRPYTAFYSTTLQISYYKAAKDVLATGVRSENASTHQRNWLDIYCICQVWCVYNVIYGHHITK
jgi:hypothetical protein